MKETLIWIGSLLGFLALIGAIALVSDISDKHGQAIANNLGNKIEAWTK